MTERRRRTEFIPFPYFVLISERNEFRSTNY